MVAQLEGLTRLLREFWQSEARAGFILIACTVLSLVLANSAWGEAYRHLWHYQIIGHPLEYWINDGLMTLFFLLVGLEIKREIYIGELKNIRAAMLPVFAALGGMLFPAAIHLGFNVGLPSQAGAGIPMATDIAFALGVLMLLGKQVPVTLKIFLTALAIIDDLGAIVVIALFYSHGLAWSWLAAAGCIFGLLALLNYRGVLSLIPYLLLGAVAWFCMLHSGIHATISGVILAFLIPFLDGSEQTPSAKLQHQLHTPIAYFILPIFALANTGILIPENWSANLLSTNSVGIMLGLIAGKPLGIVLFSLLAVVLGLSRLPQGLNWRHITGAGLLGGIGFTMSMFITLLAFDDEQIIIASKLAIMLASVTSAVLGLLWLKLFTAKPLIVKAG